MKGLFPNHDEIVRPYFAGLCRIPLFPKGEDWHVTLAHLTAARLQKVLSSSSDKSLAIAAVCWDFPKVDLGFCNHPSMDEIYDEKAEQLFSDLKILYPSKANRIMLHHLGRECMKEYDHLVEIMYAIGYVYPTPLSRFQDFLESEFVLRAVH